MGEIQDDAFGPEAPQSEVTATSRPGNRVWLYNSDGEDVPVGIDDVDLPVLEDGQLLWADIDVDAASTLDRLWDHLGIASHVDALNTSKNADTFRLDDILELKASVARADSGLAILDVHFLVGRNWVVTLHDGDLDLIDEFNEPFEGDSNVGGLSGPGFTSMVLDWQLSGYFQAIEEVQTTIDRLDEELLGRSPDETDLLRRLQEMRGRVRKLRQALGPQRETLARLSHPESDVLIGAEVAQSFARLDERVQHLLDALDTTREMIVGTFDIFMTRTAQATNDIMKRLTIVSVLLLPAAVIAGIMGMNFSIGMFEADWMFWVVLASMILLAAATLAVARRNKWI